MVTAARKPAKPKGSGRRTVRPVEVMLVDDHPLWRDTLRKVLERSRFAAIVAEASDGVEAVAVAKAARPEIIVMDIQLPDRNGIDATAQIVADWPEAKVLVLASSDNRSQVLAAVEAGASGYLLKTASSDEVREAVRRVHAGELVFPPKLAHLVLDEFRTRGVARPAPDRPREDAFRREGDYWTVGYEGEVFRLRDTRGVRYLAELLHNPGREFHSLDLVALDRGEAAPGRGRDAGPILDAEAKAAYRRKLRDLSEDLEEAEGWGDDERAARARDEIEALREELAKAVGLGGRDRRAASNSERARVNVTLAIRATLKKIAEYSPGLAEHLSNTVRTGTYCSYTPDPRAPISWT